MTQQARKTTMDQHRRRMWFFFILGILGLVDLLTHGVWRSTDLMGGSGGLWSDAVLQIGSVTGSFSVIFFAMGVLISMLSFFFWIWLGIAYAEYRTLEESKKRGS